MAEISVPAWPIPIHHTKFVIAKPHPTGILMPQMPTPFASNSTSDHKNSSSSENPPAKHATQNTGVRRVSTTEAIWSVTVPNV